MQLCTFASSSSGNCSLVLYGDSCLLIDAGISCRRILTTLRELALDPDKICGILVTHEHADHICGLQNLCKKTGLPVYAPAGVIEGIEKAFPETAAYLRPFPVGERRDLGVFSVRSFHTSHDVRESVGYVVSAGGRSMALATDLGYVSEEVILSLSGVDAAILEANHDPDMLRYGPYPASLKNRIRSDRGHLSNLLCAALASRLYREGTRTFVLAHLSRENNTPALAEDTVRRALSEAGAAVGSDVILTVAPYSSPSRLIEV